MKYWKNQRTSERIKYWKDINNIITKTMEKRRMKVMRSTTNTKYFMDIPKQMKEKIILTMTGEK